MEPSVSASLSLALWKLIRVGVPWVLFGLALVGAHDAGDWAVAGVLVIGFGLALSLVPHAPVRLRQPLSEAETDELDQPRLVIAPPQLRLLTLIGFTALALLLLVPTSAVLDLVVALPALALLISLMTLLAREFLGRESQSQHSRLLFLAATAVTLGGVGAAAGAALPVDVFSWTMVAVSALIVAVLVIRSA
jgi:hypothetical protein